MLARPSPSREQPQPRPPCPGLRSQKQGLSPPCQQQLPVHVTTLSHVNASPVACKRVQEASRHLPLGHSCPHAPLSMTGFRSQPLVEPAGIQTVWVEQEGQKEKGPEPGQGLQMEGQTQHLRLA